jgi:hypothetical protein
MRNRALSQICSLIFCGVGRKGLRREKKNASTIHVRQRGARGYAPDPDLPVWSNAVVVVRGVKAEAAALAGFFRVRRRQLSEKRWLASPSGPANSRVRSVGGGSKLFVFTHFGTV